MPFTRVLPIGHLRRWIVGLRPNDKSLFLKAMGGWIHKIEARKFSEPKPSSRIHRIPQTGRTLNREPLGLGKSLYQAAPAHDSANAPPRANRADSDQAGDVVGSSEVQVDDAATPRLDVGPRNQPDISLTGPEAIEDPGATSTGIAGEFNDLEVPPDADSAQQKKETPVQTLAKTMVESLSRSRADAAKESNYLPENLADLFVKKEFVNPQVKALLYGLNSINCRELADELNEFAREIGATNIQYAPSLSGQGGDADT